MWEEIIFQPSKCTRLVLKVNVMAKLAAVSTAAKIQIESMRKPFVEYMTKEEGLFLSTKSALPIHVTWWFLKLQIPK
jgi:myosin-crossreactive antigen